MFLAFALALALDASPAPAPATPLPTPTPTPAYSFDGAFSEYTAQTGDANFTDLSNALFTVSKNTGRIRFAATAGAYAFPTVGVALSPTSQTGTNTSLFGYVPTYSLSYVPNGHVILSAGQLPSLMGQESGFTFQNVDIQRGLVWAAETTFSRGLRLAYANGKISADLGYDDGYYSGNAGRALEGLIGWSPTSNTTWQFAFTQPGSNTPGNATAAVANKREYDFMLTQQAGKLQLLPYALVVDSPASTRLGYTRAESATGVVLLANYAFNGAYSVGFRAESFRNASASSDASFNADLVGYGAGSDATSLTITPAWRSGLFLARLEFSSVTLGAFTPGTGFGSSGTSNHQIRLAGELGAQF